ncbi:chymotrypsin inhibitor Ani s 6-like [Maniola hyperantus]|uniref:chymotrypsin inhibitor Ani s 6-like n=1 Tax=Aphantopus hyperantus TaxID=2795564 RepID=UPI00156814F0|nr:uncharacterized protein LOC117985690 [Maniola hyperantus]
MVAKFFVVLVFAFLASTVSMTPVDDRKPFDCPKNEKYYKCELEVCYKKCDHLVNSPPCPQIAADCYKPSCECIDNYVRTTDGGPCIPEDKCSTTAGRAQEGF